MSYVLVGGLVAFIAGWLIDDLIDEGAVCGEFWLGWVSCSLFPI